MFSWLTLHHQHNIPQANYRKEVDVSELITRKRAAELLGVPTNWLARGAMGLNASRTLPFIRLGKRVVRYELADVEAFKSTHKLEKPTA